MTDPADLTLTEAAEAVRKRDFSSLELLDACFANIERVNRELNATIWLDYEDARESARKADELVKKGSKLGRLHGVPMAHKDMYYQKGKLCTCGARIRKHFVPEVTATVLARMSAAGAYSFGGLNMAEFAANSTGHNIEFGNCRNPWNSAFVPGGSSSGSGAAVAARMTYAALGSDTGGSIRVPAAGLWRHWYQADSDPCQSRRCDAALFFLGQRWATGSHRPRLRSRSFGDRGA
ncbi:MULTISPECIES: amidase [unclassified Bradyrhizobium]|uniref:amidase n=1 Tax=unclassified Bradyrhizobium TaxID=2631580 RepID=UPI001FFF1A7B|nr:MULTISPECIES: amidase [unclassified Bradyrhizobium]